MRLIYLIMGNGLSSQLGGSLFRSINIIKNLEKKKNIDITIITTIGGKKACLSEGVKSSFITVPCSIFKKKEKNLLDRFIAYIISTLIFPFYLYKVPKADLLYTDSDFFCDIIPALLIKMKLKKIKWVSMIHHKMSLMKDNILSFLISSLTGFLQKIDFKIINRFANAIFFYDSETGHKVKLNYFKKNESSFFVYNGFDFSKIKKVKNKKVKQKYDACFIGGLRPNKGIYDIIPIWKRIVRKKRKAKLVLVGAGSKEYVEHLKNEIRKSRLENNIFYLGGMSNFKALSVLNQSKIFFFPSHEEGWGIVMCEAMALEKPIVCYGLPVFELFKGDITKVKMFDIREFSKKTTFLLNRKVKKQFKSNIDKFKWSSISDKEFGLFNNLISEKNGKYINKDKKY